MREKDGGPRAPGCWAHASRSGRQVGWSWTSRAAASRSARYSGVASLACSATVASILNPPLSATKKSGAGWLKSTARPYCLTEYNGSPRFGGGMGCFRSDRILRQCAGPERAIDRGNEQSTPVSVPSRPDRSRELADRLGGLCTCRTIGLHEEESTAEPIAAVIADVDFSCLAVVERLRHLLSKPRALAAAIVAILRHDNYLERVQAAALGATSLFPSNAPFSDISAALPLGIQPTIPWAAPALGVASVQNVDQAGRQFGTIFTAVARGHPAMQSVSPMC
jgi:hypothetical protein